MTATKLYNKAIVPMDNTFDGHANNLAIFLNNVRDHALRFDWHQLLTIPLTDDSARNLLTQYGQVSINNKHTHAAIYIGTQTRYVTEVYNLQGIYPLKDEWVFGCSLKTRLADQTKTQQLKWLWSKDSMNSTINQRLVEQTQEMNFKLDGSGGSTLDDTLRKQYLSSSDE